jgi:hypothetical protein
MNPAEWKPPTMEHHNRFDFSPAPEQFDMNPTPAAVPLKPIMSPGGALYAIPVSPPRSNATALLNEQLNADGSSIPDYGGGAEFEEIQQPSRRPSRAPSKLGSVVGDTTGVEVCLSIPSSNPP